MSRAGVAALLAALAVLPGPARAEEGAARGWIGASGFYHPVTGSYGDWRGASVRAVVAPGGRDTWFLDVVGQEAFADEGVYAAAANTHDFSDRWYTFASAGGGTGDFFFPRLRLDGAVGRKWLRSGRLATTAGASYVRARDEHRDRALTASVIVHGAPGAVAELGGRFNRSDPGGVDSARGFLALTLGGRPERLVTLRLEAGREGYLPTGPSASEVGFFSRAASLAWREWLGGRWGADLGLEVYDNPFYTRTGLSLGVFREW